MWCSMSLTPASKLWLKEKNLYATQFWLGLVTEQLSPLSSLYWVIMSTFLRSTEKEELLVLLPLSSKRLAVGNQVSLSP